jgi:hypothetical protein
MPTLGLSVLIGKLTKFFATVGVLITLSALFLVFTSLNLFPHNFDRTLNYLSYKFAGDPAHTVTDFSELTEVVFKGARYSLGFNKSAVSELHIDIKPSNVLRLNSSLEDGAERQEVKALLTLNDKEPVSVKVRSKGDRKIHKSGFKDMSYRVNVKGDETFLGLDKFSIQQPMIRNYTWELYFADVAKRSGLLTLDMGLIDFYVNGESRGIYSYEELPQKETVEKNMRKNGPIFGLDEPLGVSFPDVFFEVYEEDYWKTDGIALYSVAVQKLASLYTFSDVESPGKQPLGNVFDLVQWAKFFALTELFGAYHGAFLKSVKLYFNPTTGLFEPLVFDAHIGAGEYKSLFLLDYVFKNGEVDCYPGCDDNEWFRLFFNSGNKEFLNIYRNELALVASNESVIKLRGNYDKNFSIITDLFYSKLMRSDAIFFEGLSLFHFDFSFLKTRAAKIRNRLESFDFIYASDEVQPLIDSKGMRFSADEQISEMMNFSFSGTVLNFETPTVLILRGNTVLSGLDQTKRLQVTGPVMLVQLGGSIKLEYVDLIGGQFIEVNGTNWSGALNFIDSTVSIQDIVVSGNLSEDAINSVNSVLIGTQLTFRHTFSDALDIDFGEFDLGAVKCERVGNDCIDVSGASGNIAILKGNIIGDKLISGGEMANISFGQVYSESVGIGVVSKDSSSVYVKKLVASNTDLTGSIFIKKSFFGQPSLIIDSVEIIEGPGIFLINDRESFSAPSQNIEVFVLPSVEIQDKMYGNEYGAKTEK